MITIDGKYYSTRQCFEARDPGEAEALAAPGVTHYNGRPVWELKDCCVHCNAPFMDHNNGRCPL